MSPESPLAKRIKRHVIGRRRSYFVATAPGFEALCFKELEDLGLSKGDTVGFKKNMDYRFKIDGVEHYRTRVEDLLYVV